MVSRFNNGIDEGEFPGRNIGLAESVCTVQYVEPFHCLFLIKTRIFICNLTQFA